jgi:hypothetical protein
MDKETIEFESLGEKAGKIEKVLGYENGAFVKKERKD